MLRVCIIGGGHAGTAAAFEAADRGAQVTLLEKSERLPNPNVDWPELLDRTDPPDPEHARIEEAGISVRLGERVVAVGSSGAVSTARSKEDFSAVVLATGSRASPPIEPGLRKPGVFVLDRIEAYAALKNEVKPNGALVVSGVGLLSLKVAQKLSGSGRQVTLLAGDEWERAIPFPEAHAMLEAAGAAAGVRIVGATMTRTLGIGGVEAVVAAGRVFPCDTLVVLPRMVPCIPQVSVVLSPAGGVAVDSNLRSSSPRIFAAGDCADSGIPPNPRMERTIVAATASGRIAGANASGRHVAYNPVQVFDAELFGLRLAFAGLGLGDALLAGFDAAMVSKRWSATSQCWIVYGRPDSRILGIRLIGAPARSFREIAFVVSHRLSLQELAYDDLSNSTDISAVAETAREGLKRWV